MRILLDLQGIQTESRFRGIGRYASSFAKAVIRNKGSHEVIIALNGLLSESIDSIRTDFLGLIPEENIHIWYAPGPVNEIQNDNAARRKNAELIREAFLLSLQPDVIYLSSLFEGYVDDAITSIGRFDKTTPVSVSLYDLIPLLNPKDYLDLNADYAQFYKRKIEFLMRAESLLAISTFSAEECLKYLEISADKLVDVSTAIESTFRPINLSQDDIRRMQSRYSLDKPFIMYSGGGDQRKNLTRLIEAYSLLPSGVREKFQLLLVGKLSIQEEESFRLAAASYGLLKGDLSFTGFVSDDNLVELYNSCDLFVFPSWHEGFGLPVLEAMSCGAPVICSNNSSLPEVVGLKEAMFDPWDVSAISEKILSALTDPSFKKRLCEHGLQRSKLFSWDRTARKAIQSWEALVENRDLKPEPLPAIKPKLAYVSPLPPQKTGIAAYSRELLQVLTQYYDIYLISSQKIEGHWSELNCHVRSVDWFRFNANKFDRVIYHFGNSPFHDYMLSLLVEFPGVVVLHDFYMSGLMSWMANFQDNCGIWPQSVYRAHGYLALANYYRSDQIGRLAYPANFYVLQYATGVIVHSKFAFDLAHAWYPAYSTQNWVSIPLLRVPPIDFNKAEAKEKLGFKKTDFIICSFGFIDPVKLNDRLIRCWNESLLSDDENCFLIFVGENHGGDYGDTLNKLVKDLDFDGRIRITGYVAPELFNQYLMAADLAVQLRSSSRGETSAAALDCMNYGLPLIVNGNGSMAELDSDSVCSLPNSFRDQELILALETLWQGCEYRIELGEKARQIILKQHCPLRAGLEYFKAIENFQKGKGSLVPQLCSAIADDLRSSSPEILLGGLSNAIATSFPLAQPARRIFLDVTATQRTGLRTGIERVARALVNQFLQDPILTYRVEPVYLSNLGGSWHYRSASSFTLDLLQCPADEIEDYPIEPIKGDLILGLDISGAEMVQAAESSLYQKYRNIGVESYFIIYDLLPLKYPHFFPQGTNIAHEKWLEAVTNCNGALCISKSVSDEFYLWFKENCKKSDHLFKIGWFHLGGDIENSSPTYGLTNSIKESLEKIKLRQSFLMVGTIEPRKGYLQALGAFTKLWESGVDINLIIVGAEGWKSVEENSRRTIPEIIRQIKNHPELNSRLFWFDGISDESLEKLYEVSDCLVAASEGEGFGLPLIEASQRGLHIIARDLPIFREVGEQFPYFFRGCNVEDLERALLDWLQGARQNDEKREVIMKSKTWKESAESVLTVLLGNKWSHYLVPEMLRKRAMDEHLDYIHKARIKMVSNMLPPGELILDLGGANCPLYKMGYPHRFKKLYVIDLPPEERHDMYKEVVIDPNCDGGEVVIKYGDMTDLIDFKDESIDFVWSGQSIEHVSPEAGEEMCRAAFRVLKKGGSFCLDTPNRRLTKIHVEGAGVEFIHPEHCIEYYPKDLRNILEKVGFEVKSAYGICEMPNTFSTGEFCYEDFIVGNQVSNEIEKGYIQFFHCVKP